MSWKANLACEPSLFLSNQPCRHPESSNDSSKERQFMLQSQKITGLTFRRGPLTANVFIALMLLVWLAPTVVRFGDEDDILVRCQGPNCGLRSLDYEISGVFHGRCAAALGYSGGAQWQNCPWCPPAKQAENFDKPDDLSAAIDEHFEKFDNDAMIKMMIKSRTPTMRHVSKTHRVALDWLFDRINLDPKTQIKYVDNKNQLADMLTKSDFNP